MNLLLLCQHSFILCPLALKVWQFGMIARKFARRQKEILTIHNTTERFIPKKYQSLFL